MIYEIIQKSWEELLLLGTSSSLPGFIFRGQTSYAWDLSTTIERLALRLGVGLKFLESREFWILTQFRRRAHNLIEKPPAYDNLIEWLTLIQHHGGPTRLLDFTHSFFVALFFACDGAQGDAALWLIGYLDLLSSHVPREPDMTTYDQQIEVLYKATKQIGKEVEQTGILPIEPERLSDRMSIQKGLSIMPMNIRRTFMENLSGHYGWASVKYEQVEVTPFIQDHYKLKAHVAKIRIPEAWLSNILCFLDDININTNTLFPGLDGFAKSLSIHLVQMERLFDKTRDSHLLMAGDSTLKLVTVPILFGTRIAV